MRFNSPSRACAQVCCYYSGAGRTLNCTHTLTHYAVGISFSFHTHTNACKWISMQTNLRNSNTTEQLHFLNFSTSHLEKLARLISKLLHRTITSCKINRHWVHMETHKINVKNVQCICIMLTAKCLFQINLNGLGATTKSPKRFEIFLCLSQAQLYFLTYKESFSDSAA